MPTDPASHHRPRYHLSQTAGYLNDPNGPIEVAGTTHLYFQSRPTTDVTTPVEWGHATSEDLVHWTMHPSAILPTADGLDVDGCWSGNTLHEPEGIRAYYSGHDRTRPLEHLVTAVSTDGGSTFGAPVLLTGDPGAEEAVRMLRDPFVWRDGDDLRMIAGSAIGERAAIRHYVLHGSGWRSLGELASLERTTVRGVDTGEGWECPQLIRLGGREIALVGSWSFDGGPAEVLAFPVDAVDALDLFDQGDSFYAPSVMRESSSGPVVFGWLRETRPGEWWQDAGWAGAISLPRHAWLEETSTGPAVRTEPVPAVDRLRVGDAAAGDRIAIGAQAEVVLEHGSQTVRFAFADDEWLEIEIDAATDSLAVLRERASRDPRAATAPIRIPDAFDPGSGRPAVRVFLDGSVVEVFTSAGRSASTRVYPLTPPPWQVTADRDVRVWHLGDAVRRAEEGAVASWDVDLASRS